MADAPPATRVYYTWMILEATDPTEYTLLSDANRALYNLIISAGKVNLVTGSTVETVLEAIFPLGTTTYARLLALRS